MKKGTFWLNFLSRINNLEDMDGLGLCLNDLSLHGHGRDMVMAGWQHNSRSVIYVSKRLIIGFFYRQNDP